MTDAERRQLDMLKKLLAEARARAEAAEQQLQALQPALEMAEKLCHEIRFASNADELWRMVGMRHEVEQTHDAIEQALATLTQAGAASPKE